MRKIFALAILLAGIVAGFSHPATAEGGALVVTVNKAQTLRLTAPARRVVVGNPAIADVSLETPTLMYLFGRAPGETDLIILGDGDKTILSRNIVVSSQVEGNVVVHVPGSDGPTDRAYSCVSGRCLHVASPDAAGGGAVTPAPAVK